MADRLTDQEEEEEEEEEGYSGGGVVDTVDGKDEDVFDYLSGEAGRSSASRGVTRSGAAFREGNRAFYSSRIQLVRAHRRLFSSEIVLSLTGSVGVIAFKRNTV